MCVCSQKVYCINWELTIIIANDDIYNGSLLIAASKSNRTWTVDSGPNAERFVCFNETVNRNRHVATLCVSNPTASRKLYVYFLQTVVQLSFGCVRGDTGQQTIKEHPVTYIQHPHQGIKFTSFLSINPQTLYISIPLTKMVDVV